MAQFDQCFLPSSKQGRRRRPSVGSTHRPTDRSPSSTQHLSGQGGTEGRRKDQEEEEEKKWESPSPSSPLSLP